MLVTSMLFEIGNGKGQTHSLGIFFTSYSLLRLFRASKFGSVSCPCLYISQSLYIYIYLSLSLSLSLSLCSLNLNILALSLSLSLSLCLSASRKLKVFMTCPVTPSKQEQCCDTNERCIALQTGRMFQYDPLLAICSQESDWWCIAVQIGCVFQDSCREFWKSSETLLAWKVTDHQST